MRRTFFAILAIFAVAGSAFAVSAKTIAKPKIPIPVVKTAADPMPDLSTASFLVIDRKSGTVLAKKNADEPRSIASLTKMMTALVVLDKKTPLTRVQAITAGDKVGGSALNAKNNSRFTVNDLIYAAFLASANDATNALAAATKLTRAKFVTAMNAKAKTLGLKHTVFADPTGIDDGNVSTPAEIAVLAEAAFKQTTIRRAMLTAKRTLTVYPSGKKIVVKNANGMLWKPEYDDILVSGGKTGYLGAAGGWNLVVSLKDAKDKNCPELLLVLFGTTTLKESEINTESLARWAWKNFSWTR
jgi:D-alanyl-D-alanine endopeptidase (penicillin-binding protein 7)